MSKRKLPELSAPKGLDSFDFAVHPQARGAFDPTVRAAAGDATITILAEIGENWDGTGVTPNRIAAALRSIGPKPVTVQINSPGGNFFDGLAIYNMLRQHPEQVTVQVLGIAASAASIIAMAADDLQIAKAGMMMIHNTQWVAVGDRNVMADAASQMTIFDETVAMLYADRSGGDRSEIAAMMDAETFMNGEQAVEQGFADTLMGGDVYSVENNADIPIHRRIAAALAKANMPRAEYRALIKELSGDMPSAATTDMPSAVDEVDGLNHLRLAAMKLSLKRA